MLLNKSRKTWNHKSLSHSLTTVSGFWASKAAFYSGNFAWMSQIWARRGPSAHTVIWLYDPFWPLIPPNPRWPRGRDLCICRQPDERLAFSLSHTYCRQMSQQHTRPDTPCHPLAVSRCKMRHWTPILTSLTSTSAKSCAARTAETPHRDHFLV